MASTYPLAPVTTMGSGRAETGPIHDTVASNQGCDMNQLLSLIVGGVIVALATWAIPHVVRVETMELIKNFVFTFLPVWVGLFAAGIIWAALFLYRLARIPETERKRLDAIFASWLKERQDDITRELRKCHAEIETIGRANSAGFDTFCAQHNYRLTEIEKTLKGPQHLGPA